MLNDLIYGDIVNNAEAINNCLYNNNISEEIQIFVRIKLTQIITAHETLVKFNNVPINREYKVEKRVEKSKKHRKFLTNDDKNNIYKDYLSGMKRVDIAKKYNFSESTIYNVIFGMKSLLKDKKDE